MRNDNQYRNCWALILGASSGFGLACAKSLASAGMNVCLIHRDRKGATKHIESEFDSIRETGVEVVSFNINALDPEQCKQVLSDLQAAFQKRPEKQSIRILLHSIAYGSLKLLGPMKPKESNAVALLAEELSLTPAVCHTAVDTVFRSGEAPELAAVVEDSNYNQEVFLTDDEMILTIHAMGISLLSWTRALVKHNLFDSDARVVGLTSEGNEVAWYGYAAVSAAKSVLESISRSIAREYGPFGIRSNIVQPGITDTPALRLIPGSEKLKAKAKLRNPLGRLTQVEDVARVVTFLASNEASWINGSLIRVDGGEHISG